MTHLFLNHKQMKNKIFNFVDKITYWIPIIAFFGLLIVFAIIFLNYILNLIFL